MTLPRSLKWIAGIVLAPLLLTVVLIAVFGWNWLRGPIERAVAEKTGRVLLIQGDLDITPAWPWPQLHATGVTFANPAWAQQRQMLNVAAVDLRIDLAQLLRQKIVFPELRLSSPVIFLELGPDGRKSWLLDLGQQDENARVQIDRLTLEQAALGYDDLAGQTHIRSELSTRDGPGAPAGLVFSAQGQYKGLPLKASGTGAAVLTLRDATSPYALSVDASVGGTTVVASGSITNLLEIAALDMQLKLRGDSLEQLFPLLGIAAPATPAYVTEGHLLLSGQRWRYEDFSGVIGTSDIAGSLQIDRGAQRPQLSAKLVSRRLELADLGPLIGARPGSVQAARRALAKAPDNSASTPRTGRVLPDLPFKFDRWDSVDAEVELRAKSIGRAKELPLEDFFGHVSLRDSVLRLDPLNFGLAGGQLAAVISLDGRAQPIQATARVMVKKVLINKLFPTLALSRSGRGQLNGEFDLSGHGNSVAGMLASADGKAELVVVGGEVSKLMMEKAGLHVWEILQLNLTGDRQVKLRCAVADFALKNGKMQAEALIFDTQVTTLIGSGSIDLAQERLDLNFNQKTKNTSPLALRSPIYVRGSFARPQVGVDKLRVAARALGAITLGIVNPLLAMIPLIDAGPGQDSDCRQLVRDARGQ
jgi:AsmA protein